MSADVGTLITSLSRASTLNDATLILSKIGEFLGCELVSTYYNVSHPKAMRNERGEVIPQVLGWPSHMIDEWERHHHTLIHPLHIIARLECAPFYWSHSRGWSRAIDMDRLQKKLQDAIYDIGVQGGVTVPIHLPLGHVGVVLFARYEETDWGDFLSEHYATLISASHLFMHHAHRINRTPQINAAGHVRLTRREIECLNLVASGITDGEIADSLSLAYPTVRFHLENAGRKLDTRTRGQTMARAAQLGLLDPNFRKQ